MTFLESRNRLALRRDAFNRNTCPCRERVLRLNDDGRVRHGSAGHALIGEAYRTGLLKAGEPSGLPLEISELLAEIGGRAMDGAKFS